jgi:hypothetical protein
MKQKALSALALAAIALLAHSVAGRAEAKTAKCYFSVNNVTYIDGACRFDFMAGDGSFSFNDMRMKTRCQSDDLGPGQCSMASTLITRKGTFGQLVMMSPGRAKIYLNGGDSLDAHVEISSVRREGACWRNNRVKLCAW